MIFKIGPASTTSIFLTSMYSIELMAFKSFQYNNLHKFLIFTRYLRQKRSLQNPEYRNVKTNQRASPAIQPPSLASTDLHSHFFCTDLRRYRNLQKCTTYSGNYCIAPTKNHSNQDKHPVWSGNLSGPRRTTYWQHLGARQLLGTRLDSRCVAPLGSSYSGPVV
jgi:hypothetical protein